MKFLSPAEQICIRTPLIKLCSCDDPFLESSKEKITGAKQNTIFTRSMVCLRNLYWEKKIWQKDDQILAENDAKFKIRSKMKKFQISGRKWLFFDTDFINIHWYMKSFLRGCFKIYFWPLEFLNSKVFNTSHCPLHLFARIFLQIFTKKNFTFCISPQAWCIILFCRGKKLKWIKAWRQKIWKMCHFMTIYRGLRKFLWQVFLYFTYSLCVL